MGNMTKRSILEWYMREHAHRIPETYAGRHGLISNTQTRISRQLWGLNWDTGQRRKRPPTPTEEICSDKVMEFCDAENAVKGRTVVEDSDLRVQTRGTMDEPVKKMNLRKK